MGLTVVSINLFLASSIPERNGKEVTEDGTHFFLGPSYMRSVFNGGKRCECDLIETPLCLFILGRVYLDKGHISYQLVSSGTKVITT